MTDKPIPDITRDPDVHQAIAALKRLIASKLAPMQADLQALAVVWLAEEAEGISAFLISNGDEEDHADMADVLAGGEDFASGPIQMPRKN